MPEITDADCGCQPSCCELDQKTLNATIGGKPLFDASCCPMGSPFAPVAGAVINRGDVVFFTGNDREVTLAGETEPRAYPEVDINGTDIAGVALFAVDNTNDDVGSTQFLVSTPVFGNAINLNGASKAAMQKAQMPVREVYY